MDGEPSGAGRIFTGTAQYYVRYRPPYPAGLFNVLCEKFGLNANSRVLDLGCGPGSLTIPLSAAVGMIIAVDPSEEMLAEAKKLAVEKHIGNVTWIKGESSMLPALSDRIGDIDLTVMGKSFHWMDRERTLLDLYSLTNPGGGVAVIDDGHPVEGSSAPWRDLIWVVIRRWLGEERRAGVDRVYAHPKEEHALILKRSPFRDYETVVIPVTRTSTLDELVGGLFSASYCSPPVLGDLKDGFEADLRKELLSFEPSGRYVEKSFVDIKMAWKR